MHRNVVITTTVITSPIKHILYYHTWFYYVYTYGWSQVEFKLLTNLQLTITVCYKPCVKVYILLMNAKYSVRIEFEGKIYLINKKANKYFYVVLSHFYRKIY